MNLYYKNIVNLPHSKKTLPLKRRITSSNIINRREIEPLLLKAHEVVKLYQQAANCAVSILDKTGCCIKDANNKDMTFFCDLCRKYYPDAERVWGEEEYPCTQMHRDSMIESLRAGGTYIYMCELGFIYWMSLVYSGGRQVGALRAEMVLGIERQQAIEKIGSMSGGVVSADEARVYLAAIPERTYEEIKAQAQMLGLCAEQLSVSIENYNETLKDIARQESNLSSHIHSEKEYPMRKLADKIALDQKPSELDCSMDKERLLLAALRRGDKNAGRKILKEILDMILMTNPGNFECIQFKVIELVVLISREALNSDISADRRECKVTLEVNNRYLRNIQESKNIEEMIENFCGIIDRMAGQIFSFQGVRHASALRKAERYIWEHYTRKISLQEIADVSGLSASYFSSIFKKEMGENLSSYLNRLRVEKAADMLMESNASLHEIADACGFEDQSWFSKIFKNYTRISPGKYREQGDTALLTSFQEQGAFRPAPNIKIKPLSLQ